MKYIAALLLVGFGLGGYVAMAIGSTYLLYAAVACWGASLVVACLIPAVDAARRD
jgi:nucleoside permease NupC